MRRRYLLVLGACAIFVAFWQVTGYHLQVMAARPRDNTRIVERPRVIPIPRTSLASGRLSVSPHHQSQPATPTKATPTTGAVALGLSLPLNTAVKSVDPSSSPCQHEPGSSSTFKAWERGVVTTLRPEVTVNCSKLEAGQGEEAERVNQVMSAWKSTVTNEEMLTRIQDCDWLQSDFAGNPNSSVPTLWPSHWWSTTAHNKCCNSYDCCIDRKTPTASTTTPSLATRGLFSRAWHAVSRT